MGKYSIDMTKYAALARQAAAEGCVLLKNENNTLPIRDKEKVAVFGRSAFNYYKSGLGSGGLVNAKYVVSILDALKADKNIEVNQPVLDIYEAWIKENPFDVGEGWGKVPWSQKEMPVSEELLQAAEGSDIALVIIGRTAGEDQDNTAQPGQYLLTEEETELITSVVKRFPRTAVVLNVGNIIDMKWVEKCSVPCVLYAWQGGQEGGNGVCDVLTGKVSPSGKLTDTIASDITDYPSTADFGDEKRNFYKEDIYVGYRYFETFAKEKVLYPFGFGLSYTDFSIHTELEQAENGEFVVRATVKNTGASAGKQVVQVYVEAPQGRLGKPARVLCGWKKTENLMLGEEQTVEITFGKERFASFDDSGVTRHKNAYVLESGTYTVYTGADVRSAKVSGEFSIASDEVIEQLTEAMAPELPFERMKPAADGSAEYEPVPLRTIGIYERVEKPEEIPMTGDKGRKLADVYNKKISLDEFVAQLSEDDLVHMFRGEGMCSPKVTPGTGSAFGGITESLKNLGIPAACTTDGPSGLRLDVGTKAFSLPNGTLLGCTFNDELVEKLYEMTGRELRKNRIDSLLGPGLNIHRNPLCGRNFEYISEDPLLTGRMAVAMLHGLGILGSTGTIKHFCANNQEKCRRETEAVVSQRALREIYLKGFEIAVKEGNARSVMTTYGPVNGLWTAGNYELNTIILREEWGFDGIVMTDWWAAGNIHGKPSDMKCHAVMAAAGNDLYKCSPDASDDTQDDMKAALSEGRLTIGQLQRNAKHILGFILKSPAMLYEMNLISEEELAEIKSINEEDNNIENISYVECDKDGTIVIDEPVKDAQKGAEAIFALTMEEGYLYDVVITAESDLDELAQLPVSIFYDNVIKGTAAFRGTNGKSDTKKVSLGVVFGKNHYVKIYLGASGLKIKNIRFVPGEKFEMPF